MVSVSDVLDNLKTLLDKFYVRKNLNHKTNDSDKYHLNGVVVTDSNREITTIQSLSANDTRLSGFSSVASSGSYNDLTNKPTKTSDFTNDGSNSSDGNVYVLSNDSRLTNARTPSSHTHGNIQNDGVLKISGTAQASKNVCTDSNGKIIVEEKNNHTHSYSANTHGHGNITNTGSVTTSATTVNNILVTDSNDSNKVAVTSTLTGAKITDATITNSKLVNGTIENGKIKDATITNSKLVDKTITNSKIADKTITNTQIADTTVIEGKLANDSVTTNKIKNSNVTLAKLNTDVYDTTDGGTDGSSKLITSGAVYNGLDNKLDNVKTYTTVYPSTNINYSQRTVVFNRMGNIVLVEYSVQSSVTVEYGNHESSDAQKNKFTICEIPSECVPFTNKYLDIRSVNANTTDLRVVFNSEDARFRITYTETDAKYIRFYGFFVYNVETESYRSNG